MAEVRAITQTDQKDISLDQEAILRITHEPEWYLLRSLWRLQIKLRKAPESSDIEQAFEKGECPSKEEFYACFKKIRFARTAAGLATDRGFGSEAQKANLLLDLIELGESEGGKLTARILIEASKKNICRTPDTYSRVFGTLSNAFQLAGVVPSKKKSKLSQSEVLDALNEYKRQHKRFPGARELSQQASTGPLPSFTTIVRMFGSYDEAKRQAGKRKIFNELVKILNEQNLSLIGTFNPHSHIHPATSYGNKLFTLIVGFAKDSKNETIRHKAQCLLIKYFAPFCEMIANASGRSIDVLSILLLTLDECQDLSRLPRSFHHNVLRTCNLSFVDDEE